MNRKEYPAIQYTLGLYSYPRTGAPPIAEVCVEITCGEPTFEIYAEFWLRQYEPYMANENKVVAEFTVSNGIDDDLRGFDDRCAPLFYGNEEDFLLSMLYCCANPGVTLKEFSYRGSRYTDISDLCFLGGFDNAPYDDSSTCPIQLHAKKDGCDMQVYLFGPYIHGDLEFAEHELNYGYFDDRCAGEPLSHGVVEVDGKRMHYAKFDHYYKTYSEYRQQVGRGWIAAQDPDAVMEDFGPEDFDVHWVEEEIDDCPVGVAVFLEIDEASLTFSLLLDGKLYPKITQTDEQVIFHYTPFDSEKLASDEFTRYKLGENPRDIVFQKEDGAYRYTVENQEVESSHFKGVVFFPPETPALEDMNEDLAQSLYGDYLRNFYEAFDGAEEVEISGHAFKAGESMYNLFRAETGSFTVEAKLVLPNSPGGLRDCWDFEGATGADVERVSITEDGAAITMLPQYNDLTFETEDVTQSNPFAYEMEEEKKHTTRQSSFEELKKEGFFSRAGLPETIYFNPQFSRFLEELDTYTTIRKEILRYGIHKFSYRLGQKPAEQQADGDQEKAVSAHEKRESLTRKEMRRELYKDGKVPDEAVVSFAMEIQNEFVRTGEIPNIAIIGEAGIGKSILADGLAGVVFGKGIKTNTPADLKAPYIGQTKYETLERLIKAMGNKQVFFIDEVYTLMQDEFGREAVTLLLPLLTGDENVRSLSAYRDKQTISIDFVTGKVSGPVIDDRGEQIEQVEPGFPVIWIAGYEDDVRLMLKENQGLYRRFKRVVLTSPTADRLFEKLTGSLEAERSKLLEQKYENLKLLKEYPKLAKEIGDDLERRLSILLEQCKSYQEPILKFFRWGTQPQNSKYFANYAGVEIFIDHCLDGIDFDKSADEIKRQIDRVISETKRDIKRQLDTVRRKGNQNQHGNADADGQIQMIVDNKTRFRDLVGCDSQVAEMQRIVDMLLRKGEYERFGITVPKGALLEGLPGVGKTFIARAMAGELQERFEQEDRSKRVGFMSLSAPELTSKPVSFISSVFDKAEEYDVCVIFIDEVDAIAKRRFQNPYYSHLIELIKQMDGVEERSNVFVLAATNAPEALDPAFTRSGRIDKRLEFRLPNEIDLAELTKRSILKRCGSISNFQVDVNPDQADGVEKLAKNIAKNLDGRGCTAGDVENIVNTAFVMYVKELDDSKPKDEKSKPKPRKKLARSIPTFESGKSENRELRYLYRHLYEASEQHFIGVPGQLDRKESFNVTQNSESRSSTAVHEVGHALVKILSGSKPFEKITCLPRGDALGYVKHSQDKLYTKADLQNWIRFAMGGRIAEEIVYGRDNISPGASQDMKTATYYARMMVEQLGFIDDFEFMVLRETTSRYLGGSEYNCSDAFRARVDQAVSELLKQLYQETKGMLADKRELIITLAREVFNRKTMTGTEFEEVYRKVKG